MVGVGRLIDVLIFYSTAAQGGGYIRFPIAINLLVSELGVYERCAFEPFVDFIAAGKGGLLGIRIDQSKSYV